MRLRKSEGPGPGIDFARGVLRTVIGGTMIAHGVRHGKSLEGTAKWFESIGYRDPLRQAQMSTLVEIGSGAAILAGVATPLSTSAVVGTMAVAAQTVHRPNGYFVVNDGWEYVAFVGAACIALSALGPGRFSVDRLLGVEDKGSWRGRAALTAGVGLVGAAAQVKLFWTRPPAK